jgi:hypothetical protein
MTTVTLLRGFGTISSQAGSLFGGMQTSFPAKIGDMRFAKPCRRPTLSSFAYLKHWNRAQYPACIQKSPMRSHFFGNDDQVMCSSFRCGYPNAKSPSWKLTPLVVSIDSNL